MEALAYGIWFVAGAVVGIVVSLWYLHGHTQKTLDALAVAVAELAKLKQKL